MPQRTMTPIRPKTELAIVPCLAHRRVKPDSHLKEGYVAQVSGTPCLACHPTKLFVLLKDTEYTASAP